MQPPPSTPWNGILTLARMAEPAPLPSHLERPEIRNHQKVAVERDGQSLVGLRDPSMISQQMIVLPPQALPVVEELDGRQSLGEISTRLGVPLTALTDLVRKLDEIGMLWGPTYSNLESTLRDRYTGAGAFPGLLSRMWGEEEITARGTIGGLLDRAEDPELDGTLCGVVAPHLDADRGGEVYAAAYRAAVGLEPPARVVILGTNHFGQGDGIVMSRLGFDTPLGRAAPDESILAALVARLGDRLLKDEMDHVGEHSIQLHLPWIQHLFGDVPIVAALVPDPSAGMLSDDGARVSYAEFVPALRDVLRAAPGRSFVVASSDLSHIGPGFGDARPVDEAQQDEVERHDRAMLERYTSGDVTAFTAEFERNGNPTRWCSIGNMAAAAGILEGAVPELIEYRQSIDSRRLVLVSCAALAFVARPG